MSEIVLCAIYEITIPQWLWQYFQNKSRGNVIKSWFCGTLGPYSFGFVIFARLLTPMRFSIESNRYMKLSIYVRNVNLNFPQKCHLGHLQRRLKAPVYVRIVVSGPFLSIFVIQ